MSATVPTRIDSDVFEAAKCAGRTMSRSAAQQINHWARLGRAFEASAGVDQRDVARVLAGSARYDDLADGDQVLVRAVWDERLSGDDTIDLEAEFRAEGADGWVTADADGTTVVNQG